MHARKPHRTTLALAALTLLLAACGGGGADPVATPEAATTPATGTTTGTTSGTTSTTGTTVTTTSPEVVAGASTDGTCGLPDFQAEMLRLVNEARAAGRTCGARGSFAPAAALAWNEKLTIAAAGHSADMAARNYFDHVSADKRSFVQRIEATGYDWRRLGENIAAGQTTVAKVVAGWLGSDGHCANVMDPQLTQVGVACMPGSASTKYSHYWTMDLGTPR